MGTDRDGATWINYVSATLNTFAPRTRNRTQQTINVNNSSSLSNMRYYIRSNHAYDDAVDFLVYPGALSYYPSSSKSGHYISGSGIYYRTGDASGYENIDLRLNDPHYDSRYFGTHVEPFLNVAQAMHNYSVSRGPANFVY